MGHDLLKFALVLVVLAVVAGVLAMFVSGYLAAYKPGNKSVQAPRTSVTGGRVIAATPTPTPVPLARGVSLYARAPPAYQPAMPVAPMETGMAPPAEMMPPAAMPQKPTTAPAQVVSTPAMAFWYYIFQDLLRIFPGLFSGLQRAFPQWPVGWFGPV